MEQPTYSLHYTSSGGGQQQSPQYPQQQQTQPQGYPSEHPGYPHGGGPLYNYGEQQPQYVQQIPSQTGTPSFPPSGGYPSPQFPQQGVGAPPYYGGVPQQQFQQQQAPPPQQGFGYPYVQQQQEQQLPQGPIVGAVYATQYRKIWDDTNVNAFSPPASIYEPLPPQGFFVVGHVAERGRGPSPQAARCLVVSEVNRGPQNVPLLAPPVSFQQIWNDQKTRAKFGHVSLWMPVAPEGYVALGFVAVAGYDAPSPTSVRCVHRSVAAPAKCTFEEDDDCIWNDRNSHAKLSDCSWWRISAKRFRNREWNQQHQGEIIRGVDVGTFAVSSSYNRPSRKAFVPYCLAENNVLSRDLGLPRGFHHQAFTQGGSMERGLEMPPPSMGGYQYPTPMQIGEPVNIVAFTIQPAQAIERFNAWKESLWFAPSALKSATEADIKLKPIFVPFYLFDACVSSSYSGEYGKTVTVQRSASVHIGIGTSHHHHIGGGHHNSSHAGTHVHGPESYTETRWERGGGHRHHEYNGKRVCATTRDELRPRLNGVGDWNLNELQVGSTDQSALTEPMHWKTAWQKYLERDIINKEKDACERDLKNNHHADYVRCVTATTKFDEIKYKIIYLPVYEASYNYGGTYYHIMINGQTGKVDGDRPMGLGKMGEILDSIGQGIAGIFGKTEEEPVGWIDGKTLNGREPKSGGLFSSETGTYYPNDMHLLLFPYARSAGWIEIENVGHTNIILGSQQRKTTKLEHIHRIKPGARAIYNFTGHWCIRLIRGNVESVKVVGVNTTQFSSKVEKNQGNKLHMVSS